MSGLKLFYPRNPYFSLLGFFPKGHLSHWRTHCPALTVPIPSAGLGTEAELLIPQRGCSPSTYTLPQALPQALPEASPAWRGQQNQRDPSPTLLKIKLIIYDVKWDS